MSLADIRTNQTKSRSLNGVEQTLKNKLLKLGQIKKMKINPSWIVVFKSTLSARLKVRPVKNSGPWPDCVGWSLKPVPLSLIICVRCSGSSEERRSGQGEKRNKKKGESEMSQLCSVGIH